ncbi:uncharacterized protein [Fopius arisanus]|uniref:WrbA protein n=1 Tax=Fopius arisanus TaxID=64838 RepID=A0A0C9RW30_9HYME|nr:PREDICTED: uncharacterized protein LOC105274283 [Fopius arisanus]
MMSKLQVFLLFVCLCIDWSYAVNHQQCEIIRAVDSDELSVYLTGSQVQAGSRSEFWYSSINFLQDVSGPLQMTYKVEKWNDALFGGGSWGFYTDGSGDICRQPGNDEPGSWAKFIRDLLGVSNCPISAGDKTPDSTILSTNVCRNMVFYYGVDTSKYKYRVFLTLNDASGSEILSGQVVLPIR